jgi:hypothetical protein
LAGQGEDSVSVLPLLQGDTSAPVRDHLVHHSCSGKFAIRRGDWVFVDAPSGDDNQEPAWFKAERGYTSHDYPGELYDLGRDISERTNLYGERAHTVRALTKQLDRLRGGSARDLGTAEDGPLSE